MKLNIKLVAFFISLIIIIIGCPPKVTVSEPPNPIKKTGIGNVGNCSLEQPTFNIEKYGTNGDQTIEILNTLMAGLNVSTNGQVSKAITGDGKISAEFKNAFTQIVQSSAVQEFSITQETQNILVSARTLGCQIESGIYETKRAEAETELINLFKKSSKLKKSLPQK